MATVKLVLDNTVLSNFAAIGASDLLLSVVGSYGGITEDVLAEYEVGIHQRGFTTSGWPSLQTFLLTSEEADFANQLPLQLGLGERSCLAVAAYRSFVLATDDADARQEAERRGILLTGTVGLLVTAVRQEKISARQANRLLADMITLGYRSPVMTLDGLLR